MKTLILVLILCFCCVGLNGCGSETTAGGIGLGAGIGLSETIKGMQADLDRREAALVERYNVLIAAGAKAEDLEDVRQQIEQTQDLRQGVQTGEHLLGVDWSDPAAAGGAIGLIGTLAWSIFSKRRLNQKYVSAKVGQAQLRLQNPEAERQLYALIGGERAARGL